MHVRRRSRPLCDPQPHGGSLAARLYVPAHSQCKMACIVLIVYRILSPLCALDRPAAAVLTKGPVIWLRSQHPARRYDSPSSEGALNALAA